MIYPHFLFVSLYIVTISSAVPTFFSSQGAITATANNTDTCCSVSHCKEIPLSTEGHTVYQCFKTDVCGNECLKKRTTTLPPVPKYHRKNYYLKKICQDFDCYDYAYDCRRCPDPTRRDFNAYNIEADCIDCYYGID